MAKAKEQTEKVVLKRERKVLGVFIDGTGLDRASRRLNRKVSLSALVKGISSGIEPTFSRYYTIVPYEDDARHRAFLDAVQRSGLSLLAKRLPPKNVTRQISIDTELATDLTAFAHGHLNNFDLSSNKMEISLGNNKPSEDKTNPSQDLEPQATEDTTKVKRIAVIVCPSRELSYSLTYLKKLNVDTVTADFSSFAGNDILKSAAKWIDLSDSETIWQD